MNWRQSVIVVVKSLTAGLPRVKGMGIFLGSVAKLFRRWDEEIETCVFGQKMLLNTADYLGNIVLFTPNYYDRKERAFIRKVVKQGDFVVDVGANIGIYTLMLANLVGKTGKVIAIEAEPANAARLRHNLALNGMTWVDVVECGVSDKTEFIPLHMNETGNAGAHTFLQRGNTAPGTPALRCMPLSSILDGDQPPKFMKMDIEGFEYRVLKQYFADVPSDRWSKFLMIEDVPAIREGNAVSVAVSAGYAELERFDFNFILKRQGS